jgi:hypothetical protein
MSEVAKLCITHDAQRMLFALGRFLIRFALAPVRGVPEDIATMNARGNLRSPRLPHMR